MGNIWFWVSIGLTGGIIALAFHCWTLYKSQRYWKDSARKWKELLGYSNLLDAIEETGDIALAALREDD